jgi:hypothetical protein
MIATNRPVANRPMASTVRDDAGLVWRHDNPAELYRWVSHRNDLIRTIAVATRPVANRAADR